MKEELVSFETAKLLKEKGFDEVWCNYVYCIGYNTIPEDNELLECDWRNNVKGQFHLALAPTQSLAQKWLRENHNIYVTPDREEIGSDEWNYSYKIEYLPKDKKMAKRRCPEFITIYSYKEYGGIYTGAWGTYEEALEEGLKEGLMLTK